MPMNRQHRNKSIQSRRRILQSAAAVGIFAITNPIGSVAGQTDSFSIEHRPFSGTSSHTERNGRWAISEPISVRTSSRNQLVPIGPEGYDIRIVNAETEESVMVSPLVEETVEVTQITTIHNGSTPEIGEISLWPDDGDNFRTEVEVSGDIEMFENNTIAPYVVELVENNTVISSTGEKYYGMAYEYQLKQDGRTARIHRNSDVDPEFDIELSIYEDNNNLITTTTLPNESGTEFFEIDIDEFDVESDVYKWDLEIYEPNSENRIVRLYSGPEIVNLLAIYDEGEPVPEASEEGSVATQFEETSESTNVPIIPGLGGVVMAGMGYGAYKYMQMKGNKKSASIDSTSDNTAVDRSKSLESNQSPPEGNESAEIRSYADITTTEVIRTEEAFQVTAGNTSTGQEVWVITPSRDDETISTDTYDAMLEQISPWAHMDPHPNLLEVYGHGSEPLVWAAVEPVEGSPLSDGIDDFSTEEILEVLIEVCEAVHHIQRYGLSYQQLSMDSVFINDNGTAVLNGILDHIGMIEPVYKLPNQDEDPTTERADVYRISAMLYEILTGELPNHPDVTPASHHTSSLTDKLDDVLIDALSPDPVDRPETVLHLRDKFESNK